MRTSGRKNVPGRKNKYKGSDAAMSVTCVTRNKNVNVAE